MNNMSNAYPGSISENAISSYSNYSIQHTPQAKTSVSTKSNGKVKSNPLYDNDAELDTLENSYNTHKDYSTASTKYLGRESSCTTNDFYPDACSLHKDFLLDSCLLASSLDFSNRRMHIPKIVKASHTLLSRSAIHSTNIASMFIPYNRHRSAINEKYITIKQQATSLKPKAKLFNIMSRKELLACIGNKCRLMRYKYN
jgi:hypothetical protein